MTKRKKKLTPEQRLTVASYHEKAYGGGMKRARSSLFDDINRSRFQPDMYFIRGFLDAPLPLFGDTAALMRSKFEQALQEAILDDFFDNAALALQKIKARPFDTAPRF